MKSFSSILALGSLVMVVLTTATPTSAVQVTPAHPLGLKRQIAYGGMAGSGSSCTSGSGCTAKGENYSGRGCEHGAQCHSAVVGSTGTGMPSPPARRGIELSGADLQERLDLARRAALDAWRDAELDNALVARMLAMGQ